MFGPGWEKIEPYKPPEAPGALRWTGHTVMDQCCQDPDICVCDCRYCDCRYAESDEG